MLRGERVCLAATRRQCSIRGLTLVEILISITISLLLLGVLLGFTTQQAGHHLSYRHQIHVEACVRMAREEIARELRSLEPGFWQDHPVSLTLCHADAMGSGALQITKTCPETEDTDCLMLWDIAPPSQGPTVYRIVAENFPDALQLESSNPLDPPGILFPILPGSALIVADDQSSYAFLTRGTQGDWVLLAPSDQQPWSPELPEDLMNCSATLLGLVSMLHITLVPEPGRGKKLSMQRWEFDGSDWRPRRRKTSVTHLQALQVEQETGDLFSKLFIEGMADPVKDSMTAEVFRACVPLP